MSGFGGVVMTNHLCALVEGRFKKEPRNFVLTSFTDFAGNTVPHVGEENEILQCPPTIQTFCNVVPRGIEGKGSNRRCYRLTNSVQMLLGPMASVPNILSVPMLDIDLTWQYVGIFLPPLSWLAGRMLATLASTHHLYSRRYIPICCKHTNRFINQYTSSCPCSRTEAHRTHSVTSADWSIDPVLNALGLRRRLYGRVHRVAPGVALEVAEVGGKLAFLARSSSSR